LEVTMHAAFGKSGLLRKASDALLPVFTNRVENDQALGPQSHSGGPCSEGWLKSCLTSALQSTRSTTHCPALETWPHAIDHHTGKVLAYVFGRRKDSVFLRLQELLEPFGITKYYTDGWGAYERHLDAEQ